MTPPERRRAVPWEPVSLRRRGDIQELAYVVLDELEGGSVGLTITPWPMVDELGRLLFDLDASFRVGARATKLRTHLSRHRTPAALARRALRIGDVFAVGVRGQAPTLGGVLEPADWMGPPVIDVSADARDVAKLAFFAAVAPLLDQERDQPVIALAPSSTATVVRGATSRQPKER